MHTCRHATFIGQYYVNTAGRAPSIGSRTQRAVHRAWDSGHSGSYTKHLVVDTAGRGPIIEVDTTGRGPIIGVDTTDRGPSIGVDTTGRGPIIGVDTTGRGPIIGVDTTGRGPIIGVDTTDRGPSIRSRTQRYGTFDGDQDPTDDDVQDV